MAETVTPLWTPPGSCVRAAWLVLGGLTVQLHNPSGGWFCSKLDLGYPTVRDVMFNRPASDGAIDRTQNFGARIVTADISALQSAGAQIDAAGYQFAPFMVPSARPVLHYVLDRPGAAERTLTVRPSGWSWPIDSAYQRDIQLQFVAADPYAYNPTVNTVTTSYPNTSAQMNNLGDVTALPVFQITGPLTGVTLQLGGPSGFAANFQFLSTYTIAAGHFVTIDAKNKTVYLDGNPTQPALAQVSWPNTAWPYIPAGSWRTQTLLAGTGFTFGVTQVTCTWQDAYYL